MNRPESKLQQQCVKWFDYQYPHLKYYLFAIPNGGKRNLITATILKSEGVRAGVSDLFLCVPKKEWHGFFIEMKSTKGKLSEKQEAFIGKVRKLNYKAEVVKSFDQFRREMEMYLQI